MMDRTLMLERALFAAVLALICLSPSPALGQQTGLTLEVEKVLTGDVPPAVEEFTFSLTARNGGPLPDDPTFAIEGEGSRSLSIDYEHPGTFYYQLRENAGTTDGYTYDDTVYDVTVVVTSDGAGGLSAVAIISKDGSTTKEPKIVFENAYSSGDEPDEPDTPEPDEPDTPEPDEPDTPEPDEPGDPGEPGGGIPFSGEVALPVALIALTGLVVVTISWYLRKSSK